MTLLSSPRSHNRHRPPPKSTSRQDSADIGQRERLTQQLDAGAYECMVCLESVRPAHAVWDCDKCYAVFHIHCLKKWSKTTRDGECQKLPQIELSTKKT